MDATTALRKVFRWRPVIWLLAPHTTALLFATVLITGAISYVVQRDYQSAVALLRSRLSTAAGFRTWTLRVSLQQSQDDVGLLADLGATSELLTSHENVEARRRLLEQFHSYREIFEYAGIFLLDSGMQIVLADAQTPLWTEALQDDSAQKIFRSVESSGHYSVSIIRARASGLALLFAMPVFVGTDNNSPTRLRPPVGIVAIASPFSRELAPLLTTQSEPSNTGETLLIRLDENRSEYASRRRFAGLDQNGVLLTDSLLKASHSAVEDRVTFGRFKDYRGVEVMAGMQKISEIHSVIVSKIDSQEALRSFHRVARFQIVVGGTMLVLVNGLILLHKRNATARQIKQTLARQKHENQMLETKVAERTHQLTSANERLQEEIRERERAEEQIRSLNANLEDRIRDRTASLEAANAGLEAFSYSVSHDLRAPLRGADFYATSLWEDFATELSEEARQLVQKIQEQIKLMAELINGLLTLSRLGRQELRKQRLSPADLVREAWNELVTEHDGRNVELVIGDLPSCEADPLLLRQVFVNLLSNALKYTRKKETARIEVGSADSVYYVRDNGAGFDMRYADRLFGVFQRLHRAEDFEGIGIGLANVRQIVQRHGGQVWAEGAVDQGATFFFTLASRPFGRR